jgi:hypothetical protein
MANPILEQRFLGRITPGMDVCDVGGSKLGSVTEIHRFTELPNPEETSDMPDEYLEVKTGFFGMGKHFFVPMSMVQEVLSDSVYLGTSKEELETKGFDRRPEHLPQNA